MPTIEITSEQAEALARGKDIKVTPKPKQKVVIAIGCGGAVYEVFLLPSAPWDYHDSIRGDYRILRSSSGCDQDGRIFHNGVFPAADFTFVEVPDADS